MFVQEKGACCIELAAGEVVGTHPSLMGTATIPDWDGIGLREKRDIFVGDLPRRHRRPFHKAIKRGGGRMTSLSTGARRWAAPLYVSLGCNGESSDLARVVG